ncbi:MAG: neutral/alkaline non-lysosomal ceramidase N-terminal domain-containing protein, partial [Singulisphaera sp.]
MTRFIATVLIALALCPAVGSGAHYRIGRAKSDITLPVWGIQMLGYVHPQQVGQGLRQRQYARTFVIADSEDRTRLAYVTCEVAFVTHTVKLAVLDRLQEKLGDRYDHANLIVAGTHTHGTPGGYHH